MTKEGLNGTDEIKLFRGNSRLEVAKYMLLTQCKLNQWSNAYHIIQEFDDSSDKLDETARLLLISMDESKIDGGSEAQVILDEIEEPEEIDEFDEIKKNE